MCGSGYNDWRKDPLQHKYISFFGGYRIMDIMFEKCLRELLVKCGKTQRELADHLLISTQAVSKWCRGENLPDIALLPRIASFLNVSVDELLGVGEVKKQEKIQEYRKKSFELARDGKNDERLAMWREAYAEFPNDLTVNTELMHALYITLDGEFHDEAMALGERILRESTDEYQRSSAIQVLCRIHSAKGNKEKAKEYANMSNSMQTSRDVLLSAILDGDEGMQQNTQLMLDCLDIVHGAVAMLSESTDADRAIQLKKFYLKMLELYFDDDNYGYFSLLAIGHHRTLAEIYLCQRKDEQKACEHLKAAFEFAKQYDCLPDPPSSFVYTSTLLSGYKNKNAIFGIYQETECEHMLQFLRGPEYDSVRDKDWFKAIVEELEAQNS